MIVQSGSGSGLVIPTSSIREATGHSSSWSRSIRGTGKGMIEWLCRGGVSDTGTFYMPCGMEAPWPAFRGYLILGTPVQSLIMRGAKASSMPVA